MLLAEQSIPGLRQQLLITPAVKGETGSMKPYLVGQVKRTVESCKAVETVLLVIEYSLTSIDQHRFCLYVIMKYQSS